MLRKTKLGVLVERIATLSDGILFLETVSKGETMAFIIEMNHLRLDAGLKTDGEIIANQQTGEMEYSYVSELIYAKIGRSIQAGSNYTMNYTGEFYKSINISEITEDLFQLDADPIKDDGTNLFEVYGREILGLSDNEKTELAHFMKPIFIKLIRQHLAA